MKIKIEEKTLPEESLSELQITGHWHSLFNKGRLILHSNAFMSNDIFNDSIKVGKKVDIYLDEGLVINFKILAFNLLQATENFSKTAADLIELILISSWYMEDELKTIARIGTSSQIIKQILDEQPNVDELQIEAMSDPVRKRYQLGTTNFEFIESLRSYLTTTKSVGLLFNGLYGKTFKLTTFESLSSKASIYLLRTPGTEQIEHDLKNTLSNSKFYYNENKQLTDLYALTENVTELQLDAIDETAEITAHVVERELLSGLSGSYVQKVVFSSWEISPEEQQIIATRADFLAEVEFNEAVLITNGINSNFDIGSKITVQANKNDEYRDAVISSDYIIKGITFSSNTETEEEYTKLIVIPLLDLD